MRGAAANPGRSATLTPAEERAIEALFAPMTHPDHPGVAFTIFRGDRPILERCYGLADVEQHVPVTRDTIFRIGSVTKQFCATALLILEKRGALSLDDEVRKTIPEMPACAAGMTLRHLLTMTSGLHDGVALTIFGGRGHLALSRQDHLALVSRWDSLMFPPGEQVLYSNSNYAILSFVVERVSGMTLAEFFAKELFQPLGMTSARLTERGLETIPGKARGYLPGREPGTFETGLMLYEASGDGGIDLSIRDFERWYLNYRDDRLVGHRYRGRMEAEVRLANGELCEYRMGITVARHREWRKVHHSGGMPGYLADITHYPELDLGIVILTNFMQPSALEASDAIVDILMGSPQRISAPQDLPAGFFLAAERGMALQLVHGAGGTDCYLLGDRSPLEGTRQQGFLPLKSASGYRLDVLDDDELKVTFGAAPPTRFLRWSAPSDAQDLAELAGAYRSAFLGETHHVRLNAAGELEVALDSALRKLSWCRLKRRARDVFTAVVSNEPTETNLVVRFVRTPAGIVSGFQYTTFRVRDLLFRKVAS